MRHVVAAVVALGILGLTATVAVPTQKQTTTLRAAETQQIDNAEYVQINPAFHAVNTRLDSLERICRNNVAVKRKGQTIGHLDKGQKFKVIRPVFDEFGIEPVAYFGFAYGSVNARGKVPANAFNCH